MLAFNTMCAAAAVCDCEDNVVFSICVPADQSAAAAAGAGAGFGKRERQNIDPGKH